MDINRVVLKGNICSELELKTGGSGTSYLSFRMATNQSVKKADGSGYDTVASFHNVTCFKKTAEYLAKYGNKGDGVYVEGSIKYSERDGKYYTNILANEVDLMRKRVKSNSDNSSDAASGSSPAIPQTKPTLEDVKDDLPF